MRKLPRRGLAGRIPQNFRRTAVRNLERAGVPRSARMKLVGHRMQAVYPRYAIADETMLKDGALKLAAFHEADRQQVRSTLAVLHAPAQGSRKGTIGCQRAAR